VLGIWCIAGDTSVAGGAVLGRALPVGGSSGGGRKAAVVLGDAAWCSTSTSTSAGLSPGPTSTLALPGTFNLETPCPCVGGPAPKRWNFDW
jgi:hypothetical protein